MSRDPKFCNEVDERGMTLSSCTGIAEELDSIDKAFWSLPPESRSVDALRVAAIDSIGIILAATSEVVAGRFEILRQIIEALELARQNKPHPLIAVPFRPDQDDAKQRLTVDRIQADAAAILEYGQTDHNMKQSDWAEQIATTLGEYGLCLRGEPYTGSAILDWRKKCVVGKHRASDHYSDSLAFFRECKASPAGALNFIAWACDNSLVGTHRKRHPGFSK